MASTWDISTSIYEAVSMQICFPVLFALFRRHVSCNWDILVGRNNGQNPSRWPIPAEARGS